MVVWALAVWPFCWMSSRQAKLEVKIAAIEDEDGIKCRVMRNRIRRHSLTRASLCGKQSCQIRHPSLNSSFKFATVSKEYSFCHRRKARRGRVFLPIVNIPCDSILSVLMRDPYCNLIKREEELSLKVFSNNDNTSGRRRRLEGEVEDITIITVDSATQAVVKRFEPKTPSSLHASVLGPLKYQAGGASPVDFVACITSERGEHGQKKCEEDRWPEEHRTECRQPPWKMQGGLEQGAGRA